MQGLYLELVKRGVSGYLDSSCEKLCWDTKHSQQSLRAKKISASVCTLLSTARLDNIEFCIKTVLEKGIPGDILEAGCWKGGAAIFAKACLKAYQKNDHSLEKILWCADKFEDARGYYSVPLTLLGQPFLKLLAKSAKVLPYSVKNNLLNWLNRGFPEDQYDEKTIDLFFKNYAETQWTTAWRHQEFLMLKGLDAVKENFRRYALLDDQVQFLPGWFSETLPAAAKKISALSVLRADGDFYQSTQDILQNLYTLLQPGGFCIVDDYGGFSECQRAVDEFRSQNNINDTIQWIDEEAVFWEKT